MFLIRKKEVFVGLKLFFYQKRSYKMSFNKTSSHLNLMRFYCINK